MLALGIDVSGPDWIKNKGLRVIGGGTSAATSVARLAALAKDAPETRVVWATRAQASELLPAIPDDPLRERAALYANGRALAGGSDPAVTHVGGVVVDGFEFNSATHRYRVSLLAGEQARVEEVDQVIVNTGFGPDNSIYRELQVHECYGSRGPMNLSAALLDAAGAAGGDCLKVPAFGVDVLKHPEPDFFILGGKSYARYSTFLLETGHRQVADVVAALAGSSLTPATT